MSVEQRPVAADWNVALLELLLPTDLNACQPVVLSCDEETVRAAGETLGLNPDASLEALLDTVRAQLLITQTRGLHGVASFAREFAAIDQPRPTPPWLALLCLCVVAASRMDRSAGTVTHDYYSRALELFALERTSEQPPLTGFYRCRPLWFELERWLREDEQGARGLLVLPASGHRHVGLPISQTIFRERDRRVLRRFFARQRAEIAAGWEVDLLTQLRGSAFAHELTLHARELVDSHELDPQLRSALKTAYASWDGALVDEQGLRLWPVELRLDARPRGVALGLTCPRFTEPVELQGPDGPLTLPGFPFELALPLSWLGRLATGSLRLTLAGRPEGLSVPSGETFLFETAERGLLHVARAGDEPLWVLSRDGRFAGERFDDRRYPAALLPAGWTLVADVSAEELPEELRRQATAAARSELELVGGLPLGPGVWLDGHPPLLRAGALAGDLAVLLDTRQIGTIASFGELDLAGTAVGPHVLAAGGARIAFELAATGPRAAIGELRWDLGDPPLFRAGAVPAGYAGRPGVGPFVCGTLVEGLELPVGPVPLFLRANAPVHALRADGTVTTHTRPQPAGWMRDVGLEQGSSRWQISEPETVEWLIVTGETPRVLRVGSGEVADGELVADLVERYEHAPVHLHPAARSARDPRLEWKALYARMLAEEEL